MRDLRFKCWNKTDACWVAEGESMDLVYSAQVGCFMFDNDMYDLARKDIEFVQFTYLKDKLSQDLYEDDVIRFLYEEDLHRGIFIGYIEWNADGFWQVMVSSHGFSTAIFSDKILEYEKLGNLHENPNLLKEGSLDC